METISDRQIYFWLATSGISVKKLNAMLSVYTPSDIWENIQHEHFKKMLGEKPVSVLKKTRKQSLIDEQIQKFEKNDIFVITRADIEFPDRLSQDEVNPPLMLYCKGDTSLLKDNCIAVIGSRKCTRYGKETTEKITRELVAGGVTIVAGLATGIDGYAHSETVAVGGKTIAVLGAGFDHIYPPENTPLYKKILDNGGLVICEYPPDVSPQRYTFPERNRIISGLSLGIVIVEAEEISGTLITAACALEQGREVYAIPGNITSDRSVGTNKMILENSAKFTLSAKQIFDDLKWTAPEIKKNTVYQLDFSEQTIYNLLENQSRPFDELLIESKISAGELTAVLSTLELKGIIKRLPSNYYSKA